MPTEYKTGRCSSGSPPAIASNRKRGGALRSRVPAPVKAKPVWPSWAEPALAAGTLAAAFAALYWPVLVGLARQWGDDPNYSHGFLIPVLAAYLVWERRAALQQTTAQASWSGLWLLLPGLCLLAIGQIGAELFMQRLSLVIVAAGLVLLVRGRDVLRVWSLPLAFLLFMIPLPAIVLNAVAFPLQGFAAQAAASSLMALEIPVLREGNVIMLANTTLEVAEACSGIRSLMSLLALATVYAYFTEPVVWKRWVLVVAAVPVAIIANAFRVAGTGVLAHYVGEKAAKGFYHDFSGWLVFVVAFVLLLALGAILKHAGGLFHRAPHGHEGRA